MDGKAMGEEIHSSPVLEHVSMDNTFLLLQNLFVLGSMYKWEGGSRGRGRGPQANSVLARSPVQGMMPQL